MYAFLVHKKVVGDDTVVVFSHRQMTCYNGMNRDGAMAPILDNNVLVLRVPTARLAEGQSPLTAAEFLTHATHGLSQLPSTERAGFEIMALGYLKDTFITPPSDTAEIGALYDTVLSKRGQSGAGQNYSNIASHIGSLLKRECIFGRYYDAIRSEFRPTIRDRTNNEKQLSFLLSGICLNSGTGMNHQYRGYTQEQTIKFVSLFRSNSCFRVLAAWETYDGMSFELVGSERPSGLAVTYLQAWRNTVSYWANYPAMHPFLLNISGRLNIKESALPIISALFQGSDDSDILTYAGVHFQLSCFKHTIWNNARFYRDQRPMATEGRYNKGGQSSHIHQAMISAGFTDRNAPPVGLLVIKDKFTAINNMVQAFSASTLAAYDYNLEVLLADYRRRNMRELNAVSPTQLLTSFLAAARAADSYLPPAVPASPVNGAAQGFSAWVATAEVELTIH